MTQLVRPIVGIAVLAGIASPFVLARRGATPAPINTREIAEIHGDSLVSMLVTANTPVQGTRPRVLNRGTQLDGMLRAAPSQRMVIAANPFEDVWRSGSVGGIDLATGAYSVQETDIALPATGFSWVVGRTYNAQQEASGSHMDSNGVQGANWFQSSQPSLVFYDHANNAKDMVYLMYGADRFAEYLRVDASGSTFKGVNGAAGVFLHTAVAGSEPDTYVITCYDPAYKPHSCRPDGKFDGVVCTDVLEHCPEEDIDWIIEDLFRYAERLLFVSVACTPARKHFPNGANVHSTVRSAKWWAHQFVRFEKEIGTPFEVWTKDTRIASGNQA